MNVYKWDQNSVWKYFKWILQFIYILLVTKNVEIRTKMVKIAQLCEKLQYNWVKVCEWAYENIINEILSQSTQSLVPNMFKLA